MIYEAGTKLGCNSNIVKVYQPHISLQKTRKHGKNNNKTNRNDAGNADVIPSRCNCHQ